jgi:D-tyrosyl-tRNA(Tyr) deacylase
MRAVCQRVSEARVTVDGAVTGEIGAGLVVLVGIEREDGSTEARELARKVAQLRIFEDDAGRFARSVVDTAGAVLVVSQFTLVTDSSRKKGNRPDFSHAAPKAQAEPLYEAFCATLRELSVPVQTGVFGALMALHLVNDGPVTIILDT